MTRILTFAAVFLTTAATPAFPQISFELVGARALGMGGAFVAVADDPTAGHWNPAGLINGGPGGMTVGWDQLRFGDPKLPAVVGVSQDSNKLTSVSTYPMGFNYGYFQSSRVVALQADGTPVVNGLIVHHYGVTVVQSLMRWMVVGTTVKYLRGQATTGETASQLTQDALDEGMNRHVHADGAFDLDVGILGTWRHFRAGLAVKNLSQPTFVGSAGFETQLKRRVRLGLAVLPVDGLTLAFDVDLDTADPLVGLRRMMAIGAETRLGPALQVRSGVRWSRDGERRPIASAGASVRIRRGMWLDGYSTYSRFDDRGFGIAFRAGS